MQIQIEKLTTFIHEMKNWIFKIGYLSIANYCIPHTWTYLLNFESILFSKYLQTYFILFLQLLT